MEGHCSTGQSPQWAVVPMEEEEVQVCLIAKFLSGIILTEIGTCGQIFCNSLLYSLFY